ncbi:UDP-N-acetylmuramoyl-L-alanyl-D-glutamate--2,6-diaminopimelate ligase [Nocardiopsis ansamitocini]|uniref:UDP-N-acetylmuramoyl-L-alanyl-D-glutamate--2,6-diaminopimelate ligase n=1 Tax=Nocardiopsis ansamitocini TaxID=1670832 RepID=A0A9W6UJ84_9ACTN|nr:UDP-N-acetylmuramoyl-L-alanyl-D-glutamate--2,6-diaminopimelate ligase [Nocardiopsis ansamitocini]GLU48559.1 UDP-N-acetylmuramoyl-L-alanyl-D-glutamate--2,6-diaminopimelate ligase [Nocardiopsis ansamitocini]
MQLSKLLAGCEYEVIQGDPWTEVTAGACLDAERAAAGCLFVALSGPEAGGAAAGAAALARGAAAVLVDGTADVPGWVGNACVVRVADARVATAVASAHHHGEPGRAMEMVAVTGTNGKTSVSSMVESVLRIAEGARVGVIGTLGSRIGDALIPMPPTVLSTPEAPELQYLLARMRAGGATSVVLEATSMALLNHRVDRAFIDVGVFTNLTQDHLDDHGTMEDYRDAKLGLFRGLCGRAVVNADDPVCAVVSALMPGATATYALDAPADYRATDLFADAGGTRFTLHHGGRKYPAAVPVPGRFSVSNALAAVAACHALGHDLAGLVSALERIPPVPGRFERFATAGGATVVVDYAHSPDSLEKVLTAIRGFATGRVITVFGCGGDRDITKRAEMGRIAGTHSDLCVLTSDNPRTEDPETILDQIAPGLVAADAVFRRLTDRRAAIALALTAARPGDTVLIAGKGSESHQIVGEELRPFSDMATARELADAADGRG